MNPKSQNDETHHNEQAAPYDHTWGLAVPLVRRDFAEHGVELAMQVRKKGGCSRAGNRTYISGICTLVNIPRQEFFLLHFLGNKLD